MNRTLAALTIVAASLVTGAPAFAGDLSSGVDAPPPPAPADFKSPDDGREESTTCEGDDSCTFLRKVCDLVSGTYSEWESRDHGHTHGICTWPWE